MTNPADHACINGSAWNPESLMMSYGYTPASALRGAPSSPHFPDTHLRFQERRGRQGLRAGLRIAQQGPAEEMGLIYPASTTPARNLLRKPLSRSDEAEAALFAWHGCHQHYVAGPAAARRRGAASEPYGGSDFFLKTQLRNSASRP
jgi:methionine-gamma-lyase